MSLQFFDNVIAVFGAMRMTVRSSTTLWSHKRQRQVYHYCVVLMMRPVEVASLLFYVRRSHGIVWLFNAHHHLPVAQSTCIWQYCL